MPSVFTAEQAAKIIAEEAGLEWSSECNRKKALDWLNRIREYIWRFRFVRGWPINECLPVEQFLEDCNSCHKTYNGIALPVTGLTAVSITLANQDDAPMRIVPRGGVFPMNRPSGAPTMCDVKAIHMGEFSLRHDPPADDVYFYWLRSSSQKDKGKVVRVNYIDANGNPHSDDVELQADGNRTEQPVFRLMTPNEFGGLTLPDDMEGILRVGCYKGEDGGMNGIGPYHTLADIPPGITAPSWTRYKLQNVCCGRMVKIDGKRDFVPITSMLSWVESNKSELWRAGYRYVRGINQQTQDEGIAAGNASNLATFTGFVLREQEAIYGAEMQRSIRFEGFLSPYGPSRTP